MDISDLIRENSLTLMGRLTNPTVQRLWSLIPFVSNRWNLKGKAIGSDLGRGCFQFRFDFEEDLQKVLDNRPYHFDQWMVILQRWEPVIDAAFPSKLPFWIELQGLPLHYWKPVMVKNIREELGEFMDLEISPAAAKIKVLIDGLKPLIKETVVEFSDGSEARVSLEYKNLKSHCHHCLRLTHLKGDCPGLKVLQDQPSKALPPPRKTPSISTHSPMPYPKERSDYQKSQFSQHRHQSNYQLGHNSTSKRYTDSTHRDQRDRSYSKAFVQRSDDYRRPSSYFKSHHERDSHRDLRSHLHTVDRVNRKHNAANMQWREKAIPEENVRIDYSESSRTQRLPAERNLELLDYSANHQPELSPASRVRPLYPIANSVPVPIPTTEEVMGELRDVTVQYVSVADPSESAARKKRVLQGESRGMMAETAAAIIASASEAAQPIISPCGIGSDLGIKFQNQGCYYLYSCSSYQEKERQTSHY